MMGVATSSHVQADHVRSRTSDNRDTGGFILIDRITNRTVGGGDVAYAPCHANRRSIRRQSLAVDREAACRA